MIRRLMTLAAAGILTAALIPTQVNAEGARMHATANQTTTEIQLDGDLGNEDAKKILGNAWYYGIIANTWIFNGEAETNFAVKTFIHSSEGAGGQTGISPDKTAGSKTSFIAAGSVDHSFMVKGLGAVIYTPASEDGKFQDASDGDLTFVDTDASVIDSYVDAMLAHVQAESNRMAALDSISDDTDIPHAQMKLDLTEAGTQTVFLDVNDSEGLRNMLACQSEGITLIKNAGQKVVFNFKGTDPVTIQKIRVIQPGMDNLDAAALCDVSTAENRTAEDLIFNIPDADTVTLNDTAGIVLAPEASVTTYGVDGGWVIADKVINQCEWHFTNGSMEEKLPEEAAPKKEQPKEETETPKPEEEQPKEETETPKPEEDQPKEETETPKPEEEQPKEEVETPKPEEERETRMPLPKTPGRNRKGFLPKTNAKVSPDTGDASHTVFFGCSAVAALIAAGIVSAYKKKFIH